MNIYKTVAKFMGLTLLFGMVSFGQEAHAANDTLKSRSVVKHHAINESLYDAARYDLRIYADAIVEKALKNLKATPDKPLILMIGEDHRMPSHIVIQMLVLKKLKDRGIAVALGTEFENNLPLQHFYKQIRSGQPNYHDIDHDVALMTKINQDPFLPLKSFIAFEDDRYIAYTRKAFLNFMIKEKIPTYFNDAVKKKVSLNYFLDKNDPRTKQAMLDLYPQTATDKLLSNHPKVMHIRNRVIVQNALAHAEKTKARIYVQPCGLFHLAGDRAGTRIYKHSLSALFKKAGYKVLAVPLENTIFTKKNIPVDEHLTDDEVLWVKNIPEEVFSGYGRRYGEDSFYLSVLFKASGLDPDLADIDDEIVAYGKEMKAVFEKWKKESAHTPVNRP